MTQQEEVIQPLEFGEIYKVIDETYCFVEVMETPDHLKDHQPNGSVYFTTRTPYVTSLWGQVEMAGFINPERLKKLRNNKKDREIRESIKRAIEKGKERSESAYRLAKMQQDLRSQS